MTLGVLRLTLLLHGVHSLKEKRGILKRLRDRVRHRFNVSWAEVDDQDEHGRATIGVVAVSADARYLDGQLNKVVEEVERAYLAELVDRQMELIHV
jgi:uncharacterized protein